MNWLDEIHVGDCRDIMRRMIADGVQVQSVVTSPPYWGLRDYGTGRWEGGDLACAHTREVGGTESSGLAEYDNGLDAETIARKVDDSGRVHYRERCLRCGARRVDKQYGLERTWQRHVARMRSVFRLVHQVLRPDGVMWLNYGDGYAGSGGQSVQSGPLFKGRARQRENICISLRARGDGLKAKDLVGMPWRVAFALQADGWYLRSDTIWHKQNPMPESVLDRPTKAHEYVFLLAKSGEPTVWRARDTREWSHEPNLDETIEHKGEQVKRWRPFDYLYDADAIRTELAETSITRLMQPTFDEQQGGPKDYGHRTHSNRSARKTLSNLKEKLVAAEKWGDRHAGWNDRDPTIGANARSVWSIPGEAFAGAHFATFPRELVRRCILTTTQPGDVVFDPFIGSGTVAEIATSLGRRFIGCELNPEHAAMFYTHRSQQQGLGI